MIGRRVWREEEERPRFVCEVCWEMLAPGDRVWYSVLECRVLGCEACCGWVWVEDMAGPPAVCPHCEEFLDEEGKVLLDEAGQPLACELCVQREYAGDVCRELEGDAL